MELKGTTKHLDIKTDRNGFITITLFEFSLTPDFRLLSLDREPVFEFSVCQASVIELMIENLKMGHALVSQAYLLDRMARGSHDSMRLRDYFRHHPSWNTFLKTTNGRDAKVYLDFDYLIKSSLTNK